MVIASIALSDGPMDRALRRTLYPQQYRNWTETGQRWLINAAFDGGVMVVREFRPEFSRTVFRLRR